MVANLSHGRQAATIIRAVIAVGRGGGWRRGAPEKQLRFLASEDCNEIQVHFVGRPKPIEDYAEVVGRVPVQRGPRRSTFAAAR